jgi:hypothetical protein
MQERMIIMSDIHRQGMTAPVGYLGTTRHLERDGTMREFIILGIQGILEASVNKANADLFV